MSDPRNLRELGERLDEAQLAQIPRVGHASNLSKVPKIRAEPAFAAPSKARGP